MRVLWKRNDAVYSQCDYIYWLLLLGIVFMHPTVFAAPSSKIVVLKPDQDVAAIVRNAPPGTTFQFSPGVYRMQSIVPKDNDIFRGQGTVDVNGSKLIQMQPDGGRWSAAEARAKWGAGHCKKEYPRCWILNDLFIDDQIQTPVENLSDLGPGKWFYDDGSGKLFINTNPTGHKVEFGVASAAFSGTATDVEISHLIVEKYASPPQQGAIGGAVGKDQQGWTILNTEARWNHGTGIQVGPKGHVESCNIHHNGQKGLGGVGAGVVIVNNEIAYNDYAGYDTGWEAGGSKFAKTDNLVVRGNYVHDNTGPGLWTDIDNIHTLYEKNTILNNKGTGIFHEISYDAVIRNNLIKGNLVAIRIANSSKVEVYGNVIEVPADNGDGIKLVNFKRGMGAYGPRIAHDNHIHNNVITYLGPKGTSGLTGDMTTALNNSFEHNEYHFIGGGDNHWAWDGTRNLSYVRQMGWESQATISTAAPVVKDPTKTGSVK